MSHRIARALSLALCLAPAFACVLRAVDKVGPLVPAFAVTDKYVTGPTMLVRAGADGTIKEIWSGMDAEHMRHVPLFLECSIHGEMKSGGAWTDLRALPYRHAGTRPGYIRMVSGDGRVTIEIFSRSKAALSPLFARYTFASPVDLRLSAGFKRPEYTRAARADDTSGSAVFSTAWRDQNGALTTEAGPDLVLATLPAGRTQSIGAAGTVKELDGVRDVLLCIDATGLSPRLPAGGSFVGAWRRVLGSFQDSAAELEADHAALASDDPKLDRLFQCSIDAVESHQFASGDVMADLYFYRDSWIRDGAYATIGLSLAGDTGAAKRFFAFWNANRNAFVGGEREAQQPAIALTAMWLCSRLDPDGGAVLAKYWPYTKDNCDYYARRIDQEGMLRVAEEWICFIPSPATWPNAEIYSGLRAGAKMASVLGHEREAAAWTRAADRLRRAFDAVAYDAAAGKFIPMAGPPGEVYRDPEYPQAESRNGPTRDDRTDSGMLMLARLEAFGRGQGIVAASDPRFTSTFAAIRRDLENPDHSIYRFGPNPSSPHAPQGELDTWPINGSWAAQDEWLLGRTDLAWRYLLSGIVNKALYDLPGACWYLPENWDQQGGVDKPIIAWSHGEFVTSVLLILLGINLEPPGADLGLAPSLPPGMHHARLSNFRFRNWRLDFDLTRRGNRVEVAVDPSVRGSAPDRAAAPLAIRLPSGAVLALTPGKRASFTVDPSQYPRALAPTRAP